MINQFSLEGYIINKPTVKTKFENDTKPYIRFDLFHYPAIGEPYRIACLCFHKHVMDFITKNVDIKQRIIVFGSFNLYKYKDPAGKQKQIPSLIINKIDGIKILDIPETEEEYIQKQKIGFPGETFEPKEKQYREESI